MVTAVAYLVKHYMRNAEVLGLAPTWWKVVFLSIFIFLFLIISTFGLIVLYN